MAGHEEQLEQECARGTRSQNQYARAVDRTQYVRNRINESRVGRVSSIQVDPASQEWGAAEAATEVLRMLTAATAR